MIVGQNRSVHRGKHAFRMAMNSKWGMVANFRPWKLKSFWKHWYTEGGERREERERARGEREGEGRRVILAWFVKVF